MISDNLIKKYVWKLKTDWLKLEVCSFGNIIRLYGFIRKGNYFFKNKNRIR